PRRPIQIQVKSGTSATTIGRICYALQTGRYKGARVVLADDTYAGVFLRCGSLIDARSVERAGFSTARVRSVFETMPRTVAGIKLAGRFTRTLNAIPYIGAAIGLGVIAWDVYEDSDDL